MASVKFFLRERNGGLQPGLLYVRVIHERKTSTIKTGISVFDHEWDAERQTVVGDRHEIAGARLRAVAKRVESIIAVLEKSDGGYSAADVAERYRDAEAVAGIVTYGLELSRENRRCGNMSASDRLKYTMNRFQAFLASDDAAGDRSAMGVADIHFDEIDSRLVRRYEAYLRGEGMCPNSTSYYIRNLRSVYNMAVDSGLARPRNLFRQVFTGIAKTAKRAIPIDAIRRMKRLRLRPDSNESLARDMFLFSFYTRGMSVVDMAFLRKSDLRNGVLTYRRRKTSQLLSIKWEPAMQRIVDRCSIKESKYLLPLIRVADKDARKQYISASHTLNRSLKRIGLKVGLKEPLTMYVARHAWASIARESDVPVSVISQGMGHDSETTTLIYLANLDRGRLDDANRSIIGRIEN